jgi:hypothetical protein
MGVGYGAPLKDEIHFFLGNLASPFSLSQSTRGGEGQVSEGVMAFGGLWTLSRAGHEPPAQVSVDFRKLHRGANYGEREQLVLRLHDDVRLGS